MPNYNPQQELEDLRWSAYKERFFSLPIYYFNDLKYPETYEEAEHSLRRLDLEIKNIDSQFAEREAELETIQSSNYDLCEKSYKEWRAKALRAQRMKFSQIRIIEAWMLEACPNYEERLKLLEDKTRELEALVKNPKTF